MSTLMIALTSCGNDAEDEPSVDEEKFTINNLDFSSELNYGSMMNIIDFHWSGFLYPAGCIDRDSYPSFGIKFESDAFPLTQSGVGTELTIRNDYEWMSMYFESAEEQITYDVMISGKIKVVNIEQPKIDERHITLRFDNFVVGSKQEGADPLRLNGILTFDQIGQL